MRRVNSTMAHFSPKSLPDPSGDHEEGPEVAGRARASRIGRQRWGFPWRIDLIVIINSIVMLAYHATGIAAVGVLGNVYSGLVVCYLLLATFANPNVLRRYGLFLLTLVMAMVGTIAFNLGKIDPVDVLKFLAVFALYFSASISGQRAKTSVICALLLVFLPLALLPFGSKVFEQDLLGSKSFSYFQTYNAAALYYTGVCFYLYPLIGRFSLFMQLAIVLALGRIGAILSTAMSFVFWNTRASAQSIALVVLGIALGGLALWLGLLDRFSTNLGPLWSDIVDIGPLRISQMSYGAIVQRAGTTDISGYFRIKHWVEIWNTYQTSGTAHLIFGYGPGQTKFTSEMKLVPHNDFLRVLVEFGAVNFVLFCGLITVVFTNLKDSTLKTLFSVYVLYSLTDNMIDNFTSMALLFGGAGLFANRQIGRQTV